MHRGPCGAREGRSEPKAPCWQCQHTESFSYLTPSNLESELWKKRERASIHQGNGKGRGLSLPHCQVRHAANPLLRYVMLPEEMGLTWGWVPCQPHPGKATGPSLGTPMVLVLHCPPHHGSLSSAQAGSLWWVAAGACKKGLRNQTPPLSYTELPPLCLPSKSP